MQPDATTPVAGPSPSGKGKGPAKPSGNKSAKKAILKDTSPVNSDDEGDTKANDGQGPSSKGGTRGGGGKDDDEDEEENMDHEERGGVCWVWGILPSPCMWNSCPPEGAEAPARSTAGTIVVRRHIHPRPGS